MIKKINTTVFLLSLAVPALTAFASDTEFHGTVEAGVVGVNLRSNNSARFQEYRDLDDGFGVLGMFELDVLKDDYFIKLDGSHPGYDDQAYDLSGGKYGKFKYKFYYDEMPHNYSFNARSFYNGLGTNRLVFPSDPTATPEPGFLSSIDTWNTFDYSVQHKKYGGEISASFGSPFFFSIGAERREQDGKRPFSVRENIEVPLPVSYTTNNLNAKAGFLGENISAAISGFISSFENSNKFLRWEDLSAREQNSVLDPENDFSKVALDFSWRRLPLTTSLAVAASYANLSNSITASEVGLPDTLSGSDLTDFNELNQTSFDGDIDYYNFSTALVSMPFANFDSRLYYRYQKKDNNSSHIFYNDTSGDNFKELLSYDHHTAGIELGYRLPFRTKIDAGYEYDNMDRSTALPADTSRGAPYRYDNPESTTNDTFTVKLKNNSFDWLTSRLKYKHLERDSDNTGLYNPYNNDGVTETGAIRFDAANKSMDEVKLGFDFYPFDRLDFGVDFTYQNNDYDNNREGRTDDVRKNVYFDLAWRAFQKATISAFVGFESTKTDANRITSTDSTTPDYSQRVDDDFWTYGIGLNAPNIINRLTLDLSWQYQKSDGSVKFGDNQTGNPLEDINESDDYTKKTFEAKAIYAIDPKISVTLGYLYESFDFSDIAYADYLYILSSNDYYSGTFFDQNYIANVGYVTLTYKF